jgi:ribonuclease HI
MKSGASFTWQSILAGIQTFNRGCIWRVGDGSQIDIWHDSWIPNNHDGLVISPRGNIVLSKVEELINPITGSWDEELIRENFLSIDANKILAIPLSSNGIEDFVAWRYTKNSLFSVGSAYHGEWKYQFGRKERDLYAPGQSSQNIVWDILWKTSVAAKVKIFAWKSLHGILPCYAVLANRHVPVSSQCPWCNIHCEDIKHVLFSCEHALDIWRKLGLVEKIEEAMIVDRAGSAVLEELLVHQHDDGLRELILTAAWYIWWMRRQLIHGEKYPTNSVAAMSIQVITTNNIRSLRKNSIKKQSVWAKPREGYVLINVDASFNLEYLSGGIGVVIRDHMGSFIAACNEKVQYAIDASTLEAQAVSRGIALANQVGCSRIIVQSDCQQVAAVALFDDIYFQASTFSRCEFTFCNREANCVADWLSRETDSLPNVWLDDPPSFIISMLIDDVTII